MKELRWKSQDKNFYNSQNRFTFSILVSERYVSNYYYYCFEKSALIRSLYHFPAPPEFSFFFVLTSGRNSSVCISEHTYRHLSRNPLGVPSRPWRGAALLCWCRPPLLVPSRAPHSNASCVANLDKADFCFPLSVHDARCLSGCF